MQNAFSGHPASLFFVLKTQFEFKETSKYEVTGKGGGQIEHSTGNNKSFLWGLVMRNAHKMRGKSLNSALLSQFECLVVVGSPIFPYYLIIQFIY